ncbi:hypothetical protein BLNAU_10447 [Blattamonas nauphoetae]|uniref:Uncharacterized protein n=1 Tax=Blattamonas nauphoetae TaxID=2049346 RepID=A0ABQ9XT24_9EUKA|nr:hypothetical protein BLNAU_10447 [Blattamonas nauphoetae]
MAISSLVDKRIELEERKLINLRMCSGFGQNVQDIIDSLNARLRDRQANLWQIGKYQEFPMTIRSLMHSQQELVEDTRLPPLYSGDVMSYLLHPHVKVLENRNKLEQPPAKINDVQNPLVDSERVVVAFPDQQKDFSPFLSQNKHSTVRLQAQRYAKQRADSLSNREDFVHQQQQHINPQFPQQSSAAFATQNSQSFHRPPQQSENQLFNEEYATSRTNPQTERD